MKYTLSVELFDNRPIYVLTLQVKSTGEILNERRFHRLESAVDAVDERCKIIHCLDGNGNSIALERYHGSFNWDSDDLIAHLNRGAKHV